MRDRPGGFVSDWHWLPVTNGPCGSGGSSTHAATPFAAGPATPSDGPEKSFRIPSAVAARLATSIFSADPSSWIGRMARGAISQTEVSEPRRFFPGQSGPFETTHPRPRLASVLLNDSGNVLRITGSSTSRASCPFRHLASRRRHRSGSAPEDVSPCGSGSFLSTIRRGAWSALTMANVLSTNRWLHETRLVTGGSIRSKMKVK